MFDTDVQTERQPYAGDVPSSQATTTAGAGAGSVLVRQFPHLAAKLADRRQQLKEAAHRAVQPMPEAT